MANAIRPANATATQQWTPYANAANSIETEAEGRNTKNIVHPRETRPIRTPADRVYYGYTFQRLPANTPHVPAAELANSRDNPNFRIPMMWWDTFLPPDTMRRTDANGNRIEHGLDANQQRQNSGPHMPQLEQLGLHIRAPTKRKIVDAQGNSHRIVANARPQLLYPRTNTADRPAAEKHCAYGKIRDPETNSWRCIRNPNHHADNE